MRRNLLRWSVALVMMAVFALIMWPVRAGATWLVHTYGAWSGVPVIVAGIAFAWYAEKKGWLT